MSFTSFSRSKERNLKHLLPFLGTFRRFFSNVSRSGSAKYSVVLAILVDNFHTSPGIPSRKYISCKHDLRALGRKALGTSEQPVGGRHSFSRQDCRHQSRACYRAPVAPFFEHRVIMREVVSSTPAGPTLRVLK